MGANAAVWVNDGILAATAGLVAWYAWTTHRLVRTSQQQVRASQQQIESQSKPAIVVKETPQTFDTSALQLVNIGNGPALNIDCWVKERGMEVDFNEKAAPRSSLPYLEARQVKDSDLSHRFLATHVIHCRYQSISGARYASISYFTEKGVINSAFYEEESAGNT